MPSRGDSPRRAAPRRARRSRVVDRADGRVGPRPGSGTRPRLRRSSLLRRSPPLYSSSSFERGRVDAVAHPGRVRPVGEHVPEVAAARGAHHLGAHHPVARIGLLVDRILARRRVERRPAAARVVLRVGGEELRAAAGAAVGARLEDVVVLAGERRLGALLAQYAVCLGVELRAPLGLGLDDLANRSPFRLGRLSALHLDENESGRRSSRARSRDSAPLSALRASQLEDVLGDAGRGDRDRALDALEDPGAALDREDDAASRARR